VNEMNAAGSGKTESGWMFVVWWLVWIAAIAIPALLLAISFPVLRLWLLLSAMVLFLAFPGFAAGIEWDRPSFTAEAKSYSRGMLPIPVLVVMSAALYDAMKEHDAGNILLGLVVSGTMTAGMLAAFYLGRRIARRRARREHT
jgi:hypothetical protein